jgi:hypothetical protein
MLGIDQDDFQAGVDRLEAHRLGCGKTHRQQQTMQQHGNDNGDYQGAVL